MKTIVVIGANGLIGRQLSQSLRREHIVIGCDIATDKNTLFIDINDDESFVEFFHDISETTIDHVINCSYPKGPNYGVKLENVALEDFNSNIAIHLGGYFNVMRHFCEYFKDRNGGGITNLSSIYGSVTPDFEIYPEELTMPVEYAAIKSGINSLSKYFAKYYKGSNIRINTISPGGVFDHQSTEFIKNYNSKCLNKGMLEVSDLLGVFEFIVSDGARYLNGQDIKVDDGFSI
jgi:NAD(P)-dependent dehydrogenase (short-subunit alcohol dehydrogenase family)